MAPLKDTFGEGWVESDVDEASLAAKSTDASVDQGNENKYHECNLMKESFEEAVCKEIGDLGCKSEQLMTSEEMRSPNVSMKDRGVLNTRLEDNPKVRLHGGARGREARTSFLKRVKSQANFMRVHAMVSTNDCMQEVMCKRVSSKAKEGAKGGDNQEDTSEEEKGKNEESLVEVELTLKNWSNVEQKAIMEGKEMLIVCIPPWSLRNENMHIIPGRESVDLPFVTLEMRPKASFKAGHIQQDALEAIGRPPEKSSEPSDAAETMPPPSPAHTKLRIWDEAGMHVERPRTSIKPQSATAGKVGKLLKTYGDLQEEMRASITALKANEVVRVSIGKALLQRERDREQGSPLEVKEVECECCGMGEECTTGYVEHVKGTFSGHWVCGLCAEAVHEERHRLGKGIPMEAAVRTHMNVCKKFSSMKKAGGPPHSPAVAHAVCNLLSRHLSDPASPRQVATTPIQPFLYRTNSCLPSLQ